MNTVPWGEEIDWLAPAELKTVDDIQAEVDRLHQIYAEYLVDHGPEWFPVRKVQRLERWTVRDVPAGARDPEKVDDSDFAPVELPDYRHTRGVHYRCQVARPELVQGQSALLRFSAADYEADVYWDGQKIGSHRGYFAPFEIDITEILGPPDATHQLDVIVRAAVDWVGWDGALAAHNHGDAHGKGLGSVVDDRLVAGAGLLGSVGIEYVDAVRLAGLAVVGDPESNVALITASIVNSGERSANVTVRCRISPRNMPGSEVEARTSVEIASGATLDVEIPVHVPDALTWSPSSPWLYWADVELNHASAVADSVRSPMGFRSFARSEDGGFYLNGDPVFLRGTTTIGCLWEAGWKGDEEAVIRQLLLVKALFANTLRVHVHVLPKLVYDCADRLGILIYQDAPLQWHCFDPVADNIDVELQQVDELARLVRNHPSVVILSLTNEMHMYEETMHEADTSYILQAVERTNKEAPETVVVQDRTGPDRPRSLPNSIHEYPGYFVRTARSEFGAVDADDSGSRVVVSEYGAGALESWQALRNVAVADSDSDDSVVRFPDTPESEWTAEGMGDYVLAETLHSTQRLIGRRGSWKAYHDASNRYQAFALRQQTATLRRDRARVAGAIQHYLQNPATLPYNAWVDLAVIDSAGIPTLGFNALREALRPLALDVVSVGTRAYAGSDVAFTPWIFNDLLEPTSCLIKWRWESSEPDHKPLAGDIRVEVPGCSSVNTEAIQVPVPSYVQADQKVRLIADMYVDDRLWCSQTCVLDVFESPDRLDLAIEVLGDASGAQQRLQQFGLSVSSFHKDGSGNGIVLVTPQAALNEGDVEELRRVAASGTRVVLLERPSGETMSWLDPRYPPRVAGSSPTALAQPEYSLADGNFGTDDLTDWTTLDGRVVENPLIAVDTRLTPRWASCGPRLSLSAVHEFVVDHGSIVVCQALVWQTLETEPMAWRLLRLMLTKKTRKV